MATAPTLTPARCAAGLRVTLKAFRRDQHPESSSALVDLQRRCSVSKATSDGPDHHAATFTDLSSSHSIDLVFQSAGEQPDRATRRGVRPEMAFVSSRDYPRVGRPPETIFGNFLVIWAASPCLRSAFSLTRMSPALSVHSSWACGGRFCYAATSQPVPTEHRISGM